MEHVRGTVAFFLAMAPALTANVLTVTLVYCFEKITQKEELCRQTHSGDLRRLRRPRSPTANPTASPCQAAGD